MSDFLIEEALNSSAIEGAFSTKEETKELIKSKRIPKDKNEKMIVNNYKALEFINLKEDKTITEEIILELFNIITEGTLEAENNIGKYRNSQVNLVSSTGEIVYRAPNANRVEGLMNQLIGYINTETSENIFVKASIIHFYFVYIHPFPDGNGRTARVLTYMFLINSGYEFIKFFSISLMIKNKKTQYYKAIKNCEDIENDLTYFIKFNLNMMLDAVDETIERYGEEYLKLEVEKYLKKYKISLPQKLKEELKKYLKRKDKHLTLEKYIKTTDLTEKTARKHLNLLVSTGVFMKNKLDKENIYIIKNLDYFLSKNNLE